MDFVLVTLLLCAIFIGAPKVEVDGVSLDGALGKKTTLVLETIFLKEGIGVKLIVTARHSDPRH